MKHSEALTYFKSKCDLELNKSSLTRALGDARHIVYGDAAAQYGMVRDYSETLLMCNPGSTVRITTIPHPNQSEEATFDKMYICLDGCMKGFKAGCRPLIGLDGAFLKIRFDGQILAADKPLFYGTNIAIQDVFPDVHHRFCVWHLWRNFNKQWKDNELRRLLWECARSTTQERFVEGMMKIQRVKKEAWEYLAKWQRDAWSWAFFPTQPKCDNICNNACEVFNARIKEARAKPIITLLEKFRMYIMRTIA
ncbi:uncharacterized protein [Arachis hypogaea]|uniref:uncharacterized protein n=1 Tax=Arachis hypogaea TaxID=3818 RepID=UPI003B21B204